MKVTKGTLLLLVILACLYLASANTEVRITEESNEISALPLGLDFKCTTCVIVVTMVEFQIVAEQESIEVALTKVCKFLPEKYETACFAVVRLFGRLIIDALIAKQTPSKICNQIPLMNCDGCQIDSVIGSAVPEEKRTADRVLSELKGLLLAEVLLKRLTTPKLGDNVSPALDMDKDRFAPFRDVVRGSAWRGRDCDDNDATVKPGIYDRLAAVDGNCNGIKGTAPNGQSFESLFCGNTTSRSVIMFGDSASSGFHIPPEWLHLKNMTDIGQILEDEMDWPQLSWSTGYSDEIEGESIYLRLLANNRCNHRAYQNVGHNGGQIRDFASQMSQLDMSPSHKPYLAFISYIGNDVCKNSLAQMTKPEDFKKGLINGLVELDKISPPNSKVLVSGLVDGRILWSAMSQKFHPLGATYANVYAFLTCTKANPCNTWLNANATQRDLTSERAALLSQTAANVATETKNLFKNIEVAYMDFPLQPAIEYVESIGLDPSVLIEPMDGFHPSHFGHRIFSRITWEFLVKNHPSWVTEVNPRNNDIKMMFGDQGGY